MSTQITIGRGQGITQAIAQKLNLSPNDLKKLNTNIWSQVLTSVKNSQVNNPTYKHASVAYNDKTKNFDGWNLKEGTKVTISESKFNEIKNLILNGLHSSTPTTSSATTAPVEVPEKTIKEEADSVKMRPLSSEATTVKSTEELPLVATGKQLTRYVDGQKQTIEIGQNDNGQKTRYLVNKDGTRGEELVPVTTLGKNTYKTKSKFEAEVKRALKLGENDEIPTDLKPFYIERDGDPLLMFKYNQRTLTPDQALALVNTNKSASAPQTDTTQVTTDNTTNDNPETTSVSENPKPLSGGILNFAKNFASEIDYKHNNKDLSQLDNGAEIIYNGTPCHVLKDREGIHLIDSSGKEIYTEA